MLSEEKQPQLLLLLKQINNAQNKDTNVDSSLIIYNLSPVQRGDKKIITITLCDYQYKYNGFLLIPQKEDDSEKLSKGKKLHLTKVLPKKVKNGLVILIKNYSISSDEEKKIPEVKAIKEVNNNFIDEDDNIIFSFDSSEQKPKNIEMEDEDKTLKKEAKYDEGEEYTSLKQLTTFSRDFVIFVRVTKKSEIKVFESKNISNLGTPSQGKLFYFIVLDRDNNEIQCTCFNKAVDKFYDKIEEDKLYEIKGGYVRLNDKKYTRIKNDYKIVLDENSVITKKEENGLIKKSNLSIVKIKDIQNLNLYSIIDLCVVVLDVSDKLTKNTRNGPQFLKKIVVGDVSKYKIEISLWRVHADTQVKFGDILLVNNVKVGEYKGRTLTSFDETCIKVNPPSTDKYVKELEEFIKNNDIKGEFLDLENPNEIKLNDNKEEKKEYCTIHIRDVLETLDEGEEIKNLTKVTATVTQIIHNEKNFYAGCSDRNCKRKLKPDPITELLTCPNCNKSYENPTYYYTLSLRVKDASCEYSIDIFGKTAESVMKCSAEEYKDYVFEKNEEKLKEITKKVEFKLFNFWVKPKIQVYNTTSRKKLYAYIIEPYNERVEAHKLLAHIQKEIS